jgi:hypothetical protein
MLLWKNEIKAVRLYPLEKSPLPSYPFLEFISSGVLGTRYIGTFSTTDQENLRSDRAKYIYSFEAYSYRTGKVHRVVFAYRFVQAADISWVTRSTSDMETDWNEGRFLPNAASGIVRGVLFAPVATSMAAIVGVDGAKRMYKDVVTDGQEEYTKLPTEAELLSFAATNK